MFLSLMGSGNSWSQDAAPTPSLNHSLMLERKLNAEVNKADLEKAECSKLLNAFYNKDLSSYKINLDDGLFEGLESPECIKTIATFVNLGAKTEAAGRIPFVSFICDRHSTTQNVTEAREDFKNLNNAIEVALAQAQTKTVKDWLSASQKKLATIRKLAKM